MAATQAKKLSGISAFFPAHNEERNIEPLTARLKEVLPGVCERYEIIVVDDGSTDATGRIADAMAAADPAVRVIHHERNRGYGAAVKSGVAACRLDYVFLTDGDNQFDVGEITRLLPYVPDYDIVAGYRLNRAEGAVRRLNAWAWNRLVGILFGLELHDVDCAFKLFKREIFGTIEAEAQGAMISTEILAKAKRQGRRIVEVGVHHYPRLHGRPSGASPFVIVKAFYELAKLYRRCR